MLHEAKADVPGALDCASALASAPNVPGVGTTSAAARAGGAEKGSGEGSGGGLECNVKRLSLEDSGEGADGLSESLETLPTGADVCCT